MPEIARFYGIIVRMYSEAGGQHHRPHLHAYAEGLQIAAAVDNVEVLSGGLSIRNQRLLLAWAELHQSELLANWGRLQNGEPSTRVEPLQ